MMTDYFERRYRLRAEAIKRRLHELPPDGHGCERLKRRLLRRYAIFMSLACGQWEGN